MNRIFIIGLMASLVCVQGQDQLFVGTRPLSMGGAFIAVADDGNTITWNPAGLPDVFFSAVLDVQRIDTRLDPDPTRRVGTSNLTTFASLATPSLGLSYYRLRSWQGDRVTGNGIAEDNTAALTSLVTHHAGITMVQPFGPGLTVATVVKAVRGTSALGSGSGAAPIRALLDQTSGLMGRSTTSFDLE